MSNRSRKVKTPKLNNKETLIAFCATLSEQRALEAYTILQESFGLQRRKILYFNGSGVEDKNGTVRLTPQQYDKLIQYGELTFKHICYELDRYINYLKENKDEPKCRSNYNRYKTGTHYKAIKAWVLPKVEQLYPNSVVENRDEGMIDFYSISNITQAREYIKYIPKELRVNNSEIEFLVTKYPELLYEIKER